MSEELKPVRCGCGGEAMIDAYLGDLHRSNLYYIYCAKCDIRTSNYLSEAEAIEAWNRAMGARYVTDEIFDKVKAEVVEDVLKSVKIERTAKVEMLLCGNCHESNIFNVVTRQHYKYCPSCGARLEWE